MSDPYFGDVTALLHCDGTNGSTTFIDSSATSKTFTANGNAQLSTAQLKFGTASGLFDGTGDFLSTPYADGLSSLSGQFTVEMFVRFAVSKNTEALCGAWSDTGTAGSNNWFLYLDAGTLRFRLQSGATNNDVAVAWAPTVGTWYHVCVDRDNSNIVRLYIDGVKVASTTYGVASNTNAVPFTVGRIGTATTFSTYDLNGNIDELRVTNGAARYASNSGFTVPTSAYPDSSTVNPWINIGATSANSITVGSAIPAGSCIVIFVEEYSLSSIAYGTLSDTNGHTFTPVLQQHAAGTSLYCQTFVLENASMSAGNVITLSTVSTGANITAVYATSASVRPGGSALDPAVTAHVESTSASASPTVTSGVPSVANEVFLAFTGFYFNASYYYQDTANGWSSPPNYSGASNHGAVAGGGRINTGLSAITYHPSYLTSSTYYTLAVFGFKPPSPGTSGASGVAGGTVMNGVILN